MTEAEWLACKEPELLRQFVCARTSDRKRLLRMVACCRYARQIRNQRFRAAVETAERYGDVLATGEDGDFAECLSTLMKTDPILMGPHYKADHPRFVQMIRDIFGNPFRPVAADPAWLTSTVVALARGIYDDRAFDRMPILADALQDAGCDNDDVLGHCRGPGPHVRGCWVVDLVLGKA